MSENDQRKNTGRPLKPGPKRTVCQRQLDNMEMINLIRRGWTQQMIAEKFDVSQSVISYSWKTIVKQKMKAELDELVQAKLEEYGELKREAWAAWERSKLDQESSKCEETVFSGAATGPSSTERRSTEKRGQTGNASYLKIIKECLDAERELQALNPAKEIHGSMTVLDWTAIMKDAVTNGIPETIEHKIEQAVNDRSRLERKMVEALAEDVAEAEDIAPTDEEERQLRDSLSVSDPEVEEDDSGEAE
jgi:hypothetical protein